MNASPPPPPQPAPGFGPPLVDLPDLPHAWSTPYLWVLDSARGLIVVVSLYLLYLLAFSTALARSPQQKTMSASFGLAVLTSIWSQVERIGRPMSWRFPVVAVMVVLGVWGAFRYLTAGQRMRDMRLRAFFIPPVPPLPAPPADIADRLRHSPPPPPRKDHHHD